MATWELAAKARQDFADMIDGLSAQQLDEQSLCEEWTAKEVVAHLTSFVETGGFGLFTEMVKNRFDFTKVSAAMVDKRKDRSVADLTGSLRQHATKSAPLPTFPEELTVGDVAIHTQDVRRPLGLAGELDEKVLRTTLDFLTTHKHATTLVDRRPIEDVRLEATDLGWSFGDGPEITGTGEAIMMGLANRPVLDDLDGPGLANWKS
ncbi:MAG: maleylpyruvate isomerase family mycothiol-dependent enzyme [Acidimicrobiia bacterium]|nr:maleylpyruvate isomerase family mycothiol-dependent enzyme [Acidimicrobiia bacterium]